MKSDNKKLSLSVKETETPQIDGNSEIIIYQTADGKVKIDCRFASETLWLTQAQIARLFGRDISVISRHIKNIFAEGEVDAKSNLQNMQIPSSDKPVATVKEYLTVQNEGSRAILAWAYWRMRAVSLTQRRLKRPTVNTPRIERSCPTT